MTRRLLLAVVVLLVAAAYANSAPQTGLNPRVVYDQATNRLSVEAEGVLLSDLLRRIAMDSGADILMNPAADKGVSITFDALDLREGLSAIGRELHLSYALIHYDAEKGSANTDSRGTLIAMQVFLKGQRGKGLRQLVSPITTLSRLGQKPVEETTSARAATQEGPPSKLTRNFVRERWAARLEAMRPEKRKHLEELAERHAVEKKQREAKKAERSAKREAKREKHHAERDARYEEMKVTDPERYERLMRRKEARARP